MELIWTKIDVKNRKVMREFWAFSKDYFTQILANKEDLRYFCGIKYRHAMRRGALRQVNPIEFYVVKADEIRAITIFVFDRDKVGYVMEFGLARAIQRQGVGKKLYAQLENIIRKKGATSIELTATTKGNRIFWEKMGYVRTGEIADNGEEILSKQL